MNPEAFDEVRCMTALILLVFAQAAPPPEKPIEERIEAFLKGEDAARKDLLALGAYAIRPLQKARDKSPEKIDAFIFELKKVAAYPKGSEVPDRFTQVAALAMRNQEFGPDTVRVLLSAGVPVFLDKIEASDLRSTKFGFDSVRRPLDAIDQICRQTGLDYGFFHNGIVLGKAERLWPPGPPTKPPELRGDELSRARALVEKLNDDSIEAREAATRDLLKFGPSAVPLLEENLRRKEAEIVARCSALIEKLRPSGRGAFGPAGAGRQKKSAQDERILKQFQDMKVSLDFQNTTLRDMTGYLKEFTGIEFDVQGDAGGPLITLRAKDQALFDLLCLITQTRDLDFVIREGKVLIDTREAIDRIVSGSK
jgi:hypothetical protein